MERRETGEDEERREKMGKWGVEDRFANRSSVVRYDERRGEQGRGRREAGDETIERRGITVTRREYERREG
jgi:hypothetical protein